jgi:hypothetical protein
VVTSTARAAASDVQVIRTYNVRDSVITLLATAGEWTIGENSFVVEFDNMAKQFPAYDALYAYRSKMK